MPIGYVQLLIPLICLFVNVFVQIFSLRYIPGSKLLKSAYWGFAFGFITLHFYEWYIFSGLPSLQTDFIAIIVVNSLIYISLGYCYFNFITLGETARRIRILRELYDSREGLSVEEIIRRYNAKEIIEKRIKRLIDTRQIICKDGKYFIDSRIMFFITKIMVAMKLIVFGKRSEFD